VIKEHKRWMEASEVIAMFPSLVWKIQLESHLRDALNASIEAALLDMRRDLPPLEPAVAGSLARRCIARRTA